VEGRNELHTAERKVEAPSEVHRKHLRPPLGENLREFEGSDHLCPPPGEVPCSTHVIPVSVGEEDVICYDTSRLRWNKRISLDKGIDSHSISLNDEIDVRVPKVANFHTLYPPPAAKPPIFSHSVHSQESCSTPQFPASLAA